jgi:small subunit ribosomal protein S1
MSAADPEEGWLTEAYDYQRPRRGQIRKGVVLELEELGAIIDVGLKRDGFVPWQDIERLGKEAASQLKPGQEVLARIVRPRDRDDRLILSLYQARLEKDWTEAQKLLESGNVWQGQVSGFNRGGVLVQYGHIRAFVPASHLSTLKSRSLTPEQRRTQFEAYVGQELPLKVIEVDRDRRRLILSERLAERQLRRQNMERLLDTLLEGQVVQGTISRLCDFGAFVDLGGADGLIHLSELAWRRVRHPREVVQVGDEIEVYVLRLDYKRKRISLSLKRLQPSPWELVDEIYTQGQLVPGTVTNVVGFGAFVLLDIGVEGLVHVSELADPPPSDPREVVQQGDELVLRILRIDAFRHRISLSLKRVYPQEEKENLVQEARAESVGTDEARASLSVHEERPSVESERAVEEGSLEALPASLEPPNDTTL